MTSFLQNQEYDGDDNELHSPELALFDVATPSISVQSAYSFPVSSARGSMLCAEPARHRANNISVNGVHTPHSPLPRDDHGATIGSTEGEKVDIPPFLIGEEVSDEVGLSDGKKIFIDDVLETAEWYVL